MSGVGALWADARDAFRALLARPTRIPEPVARYEPLPFVAAVIALSRRWRPATCPHEERHASRP
jgi:hypothetical protein